MRFSIHTIFGAVSPLFRRRRMRLFASELTPTADTTILDVGGHPETWRYVPTSSRVTVLNTYVIDMPRDHAGTLTTVIGDGCQLTFADQAFDIVFSNSVIEHVGTFDQQQAFARECRRVGKALWIQTPARWFVIEPHLLTPCIHYLPVALQRRLLRNFTVWGLLTRPTQAQVDQFLAEVRLLTQEEFQGLFPDCEILAERFLGFTKSYVAVRRA
jgi:hypothetical protein